MNRAVFLLLLLFLSACSAPAANPVTEISARTAMPLATGPGDPAQGWDLSAPAEQGMDPAQLDALRAAVTQRGLNLDSLLVVRHGRIVFEEYYRGETQFSEHEMFSVTKSFTSTLLGIALDQGKLSGVDAPVLDLLPIEPAGGDDPDKLAMTVDHLLSMTTGLGWVEGDLAYRQLYMSRDWVQFMLDLPMAGPPGMEFNYCSGCSHLLMAVVEQQVGKNGEDYARQYLFDPLGISHYSWETDSRGTPIGGWGLYLTARDMAKFGYLYLHEGLWDGQQIVSAEWVRNATSQHVDAGGRLNYGYQWWIDPRHEAFAALGRDGQTIYVAPKLDLIVVTTAGMPEGHDPILALIDDFIVPAVVE